jgi:membrane-bound serine protease (ClpP class)
MAQLELDAADRRAGAGRPAAASACLRAAAATALVWAGVSAAGEAVKGRMITIRGAVDSTLLHRVEAAVRAALADKDEVLIFDVQASQSDFGSCYSLASLIAEIGGSVRRTVAFVGKPLSGNAVLIALACDEIVMAPQATLGNVDPEGELKARERALFESISVEKGHGKSIALGLADRNVQLFEVETPNGKSIKTAEELREFEKNARVLRRETLKEAGQTWVLSAEAARRLGLAKLIRETRKDAAIAYQLPEQAAADDATFHEAVRPYHLRIVGPVNSRMYQSIQRRLKEAQGRGSTLLFVEVDTTAGEIEAASSLMALLDRWPGRKVAWVPNKATGAGLLALFGCDELVVGPNCAIGQLDARDALGSASRIADGAAQTASDAKFPSAVVRGLIDRAEAVWEVRSKENPGLRSFRTAKELEDEQESERWEKQRIVKEAGSVWRIQGGEQARSLDLAIAVLDTKEKLLAAYSVRGDAPVLQPTWVDAFVDALTSPGATVFLLVVAMTCLYIEFQMPGFGVAGLVSAVCFALFFWSRFLTETANSLEIVLFLLGLLFLAVELFVLPGFGVTGVAGVLLMIGALVLASQNFSLPTSESETRELMGNLAQIVGSLILFFIVAAATARFFPQMPVFNRMVLAPPGAADESTDVAEEAEDPAAHELVGRVAVAASPLRPAGRVRLGDDFYDVLTLGEFIEPGAPVEIVEVHPTRIVVRSARKV